jgi:hypothetical protein
VFISIRRAAAFCHLYGDEAYFALQNGVECRAAEAELVLVRLRWRTHEVDVFFSLPMSLEKEKAKEFAVHGDRSSHIANTSMFCTDMPCRCWLQVLLRV